MNKFSNFRLIIITMNLCFIKLAFSIACLSQSATAAEEIRVQWQTYQIPKKLWLEIPDSIKQNHPLLHQKISNSANKEIKIIEMGSVPYNGGKKSTSRSYREIIYPKVFGFQNDHLYPSDWTVRNVGSDNNIEFNSLNSISSSSEIFRMTQWLPTIQEGSKINIERSKLPRLYNTRDISELEYIANSPVLIAASPDPQPEFRANKMLLSFQTLVMPKESKQNQNNHHLNLEVMLIRGKTAQNSTGEKIVNRYKERSKDVVLTTMKSISPKSGITFYTGSISHHNFPTSARAIGSGYLPLGINHQNDGFKLTGKLLSNEQNQLAIKLDLEHTIIPSKFPVIPGKGKNVISLVQQRYRARVYSETINLENGKWKIVKHFTPEDLLERKNNIPKYNIPDDKDDQRAINSHYTLLVRVTTNDNQIANEETKQLIREYIKLRNETRNTKRSKSTWVIKDLSAYSIVRAKLFSKLKKSKPELNNHLAKLTEIRPCHRAFIGRSKVKITFAEAKVIAVNTGATILDLNSNPEKCHPAMLQGWISGTYLGKNSERTQEVVILRRGAPHLLQLDQSKDFMPQLSNPLKAKAEQLEERHYYLFQWLAPTSEMDKAAMVSGLYLKNDANLVQQSAFYTGEWEYRQQGHRIFRRVLFPDGRAELWVNGKKFTQQGRHVWEGFHWKISKDRALVIYNANGDIDSIYNPSLEIPDHIEHYNPSKTTIPRMQKAVDSWLNPSFGSKETISHLPETLKNIRADKPSANTNKTISAKSSLRTITNKNGKSINAKILSATESSVTIQNLKNNNTYTIPLDSLTKEDQIYIKQWRTNKPKPTAKIPAKVKAKYEAWCLEMDEQLGKKFINKYLDTKNGDFDEYTKTLANLNSLIKRRSIREIEHIVSGQEGKVNPLKKSIKYEYKGQQGSFRPGSDYYASSSDTKYVSRSFSIKRKSRHSYPGAFTITATGILAQQWAPTFSLSRGGKIIILLERNTTSALKHRKPKSLLTVQAAHNKDYSVTWTLSEGADEFGKLIRNEATQKSKYPYAYFPFFFTDQDVVKVGRGGNIGQLGIWVRVNVQNHGNKENKYRCLITCRNEFLNRGNTPRLTNYELYESSGFLESINTETPLSTSKNNFFKTQKISKGSATAIYREL